MNGHPTEARKVLTSLKINEKKIRAENRVTLTATWGLLYLWEGDIAKGKEYYEQAEEMAHGLFRNDLLAAVRQKMYLELAKASLRHHDLVAAKREIAKGLAVKGGRALFEMELISLQEETGSMP